MTADDMEAGYIFGHAAVWQDKKSGSRKLDLD